LVHAASALIYARAGLKAKSQDVISTFFTTSDAPDPFTSLLLADALRINGDFEGALRSISNHLDALPSSPQGIQLKAWILLQANSTLDALSTINKAIGEGIRDARLEAMATNLWFAMGDVGSASAIAAEFIRHWPASRLAEEVISLAKIASAFDPNAKDRIIIPISHSVKNEFPGEAAIADDPLIPFHGVLPPGLSFPDFSRNDAEKFNILKRRLHGGERRNSFFDATSENLEECLRRGIPSVGIRDGVTFLCFGYIKELQVFLFRKAQCPSLYQIPYMQVQSFFRSTNSTMTTLPVPNGEDHNSTFKLRRPVRSGERQINTSEASEEVADPQLTATIRRNAKRDKLRRLIDAGRWESAIGLTGELLNDGLQSPALWMLRSRALSAIGHREAAATYEGFALSMGIVQEDFVIEKYLARAKNRTPDERAAILRHLRIQFSSSFEIQDEYCKVLAESLDGLGYEAAEKTLIELYPERFEPVLRLASWYRQQGRADLEADLFASLDNPEKYSDAIAHDVPSTCSGTRLADQINEACLPLGPREVLTPGIDNLLPKRLVEFGTPELRNFLRRLKIAALPRTAAQGISRWIEKHFSSIHVAKESEILLLELNLRDGHLMKGELEVTAYLKENPESAAARYHLGSLYLKMEKQSKAIEILREVQASHPCARDAILLLKQAYRAGGEANGWQDVIAKEIETYPYNASYLLELVQASPLPKSWRETYSILHRIQSRYPKERILAAKLQTLISGGATRYAGKVAKIMLKHLPVDETTAEVLAQFIERNLELENADAILESLLKKWPANVQLQLAKIQLLKSTDKRAALTHVETVINNGTISPALVQQFLSLVLHKGESAVKLIQSLREQDQVPFARAVIPLLMKLTRELEVLGFVSWCYKKLRHNNDFKVYLVKTLFKGGHSEKERIALYIANQLHASDPDNPEFIELKGMCLTDENPNEATEYLANAFRLTGRRSALRHLTQAYIDADRTEDAINYTWLILLQEPLNIWAMTMATVVELEGEKRRKKFERLFPYFQAAIGLGMGSTEPMFSLAAAIVGIRSERPLPASWLDAAIVRYDHLDATGDESDERRDLRAAIYAWMTKLQCTDQAKLYKPSLWQKTTSEFLSRTIWIPPEENERSDQADLGIAMYRIQDYAAAIEHLTRAIADSPDNSRLYNYRGLAYLDSDAAMQAEADFAKAVACGTEDPRVFYSLGLLQGRHGETENAVANLTKAIALNRGFYLGYLKRADILCQQGSFASAINDYDLCLSIRDTEWLAMHGRAKARMAMGDFETAEQDVTHALDYNANDSGCLETLVICKQKLGRHQQAAKILDRLLANDPWNLSFLNLHAQSMLAQGLDDSAIASLQKVLQLDPVNPTVQRQLGILLIAKAHGGLQDFSIGLSLLKRANRSSGESDPICLSALASAYFRSGMAQTAQKLQESAINHLNEAVDARTRAEYMEQLRRYGGKIPHQKKAS
jgi:tetratricopeptide (TPR) repeat protein